MTADIETFEGDAPAVEIFFAIRQLGDGADKDANLFAKANCVPMWKALAATWFAKTKKRRRVA
jgi:hypothetical protein